MKNKMNALMIGASGQQGQEYKSMLQERVNWLGFIDPKYDDNSFVDKIPCYRTIQEMQGVDADVAFVTVPHGLHDEIATELLSRGISIIKEKPLAHNLKTALRLLQVAEDNGARIWTTTQRPYHSLWNLCKERLSEIGEVYSFNYQYQFPFPLRTSGWRARPELALGGVLLDMGYHSIDALNYLFGPLNFHAGSFGFCYSENAYQQLDDTAHVMLKSDTLSGVLSVSRHGFAKSESLNILGTNGSFILTPSSLIQISRDGSVINKFEDNDANQFSKQNMLNSILDSMESLPVYKVHLSRHLANVGIIDRAYKEIQKLGEKEWALSV